MRLELLLIKVEWNLMKKYNKFFNTEKDRNLWIKLNAERIRYMNLVINEKEEDLGDVNTPYTPLWISNNQLVFDENNSNELRFTLEEFLLLTDKELFKYNFDIMCLDFFDETLKIL